MRGFKMITVFDDDTQEKLDNITFVESVTKNSTTQNLLLESLNNDTNNDAWIGEFDSVEDMQKYFDNQMQKDGYVLNKETGFYDKKN